ncbi:sensor domain-containing diguanylate cyclase [Actinoplanes subglobosus]|uniref:Diguanylate cyclase n=1 Tax=Actinoplanes subglobosus TaxID=1547892 RepID=A0ABV8IQP7_9ACTN
MTHVSGRSRGDAATRWIRGALALVYLAFAITNFLTLTGHARMVMTVLDTVTALLMGLAALSRAPGRRGELLAFLPVLDSVAQVAVTGRLQYSTTLMLTLLGIGAAVTSRRIAAASMLTGVGGWALTVALQNHLRTPEMGYYSVQVASAAILGALLHEALRRRQRALKRAHDKMTTVAERFERLFNASPTGVAIADETGRIVAANPAFHDLVGRPDDEVVGGDVGPYLSADGDQQHRLVRPDGSIRWVDATVGTSEMGGRPWTLLQMQDVTDRHLAEEEARDSHRLLAAVAAAARRIRTGEDARATIIAAVRDLAAADNVSLLEPPADTGTRASQGPAREVVVTDADGADVIGTRVPLDGTSMIARVWHTGEPIFLADPASDPRVSAALLKMVDGRSMLWQPVIVDGTVTAVLAVGWRRRVESVSDYRTRAVALLGDETALALEHERLLRRLERMAFTDTLTALPNRRAWQESMDRMVADAEVSGEPLTVAIADLDHFKRYNDTYGHAAGDELLQRAAAAFAAGIRDEDSLARWGGEEFMFALPATDTADAIVVLDRMRAAMPDSQTCSVGVATWDGREPITQLLKRADDALYRAKHDGRDRVHASAGLIVPDLAAVSSTAA